MSKFDLKLFIKRNILKSKMTSEDVLNKLRDGGAEIGTDVLIYSTGKTLIDASSPYLLTIGSHVRIAEGVKILTHDYSWSVLKRYEGSQIRPGAVLGAQSAVEIGDNVFIGMNAIITRGVKIGSNVIIGAGSVVTKDCPSNGVYAGNPAKKIMTLEEYYRKREAMQFEEACDIARRYKQRFGKNPPKEIFSEYFMLFEDSQSAAEIPVFRAQMGRMDNYEVTVSFMEQRKPTYENYEAFLEACFREEEN